MRILVLLSLATLALAGCADDSHDHQLACDDGRMVDSDVEGHHDDGFDSSALCVPPTMPALTMSGVPDMMVAYQAVNFTWAMSLGDLEEGHSMLTSIRVADAPGNPNGTDGPDAYGTEILKREHQDLPFSYEGTLKFTANGTVYVRAYASLGADHIWSDEFQIQVMPVQPTGTVKVLTHGAGNFVGGLAPETVELVLGESLVIQNDDVMAHTFEISGNSCTGLGPVTVDAQSVSNEILVLHPGTCTVASDDVQTLNAQLSISEAPSS